MKYLVMLIGDGEVSPWESLTPEEQGAAMQQFEDFDAACEARDGVEVLAGEALGDAASSTVITTREGKMTFTEGPYAEALEGLGGFFLMEVPDLDVLADLLKALPPYDIQVSPVVEPY